MRDNRTGLHRRMTVEQRDNLIGLDSETANLDLFVRPANVCDLPVRKRTRKIPGSVEARSVRRVKRIRDKSFGREFGAIQISSCNPCTTDVDLPNFARWNRLQSVVENMDGSVRDRPPNRWAYVRPLASNGSRSGYHRSFSGSVVVDESERQSPGIMMEILPRLSKIENAVPCLAANLRESDVQRGL